jgi:WhiB family transcriptional regulator, redox-sensing transcriptional regulator
VSALAQIAGRLPAWMDLGLCAETDPALFFPEKGGSTAAAKRICAACPVRAECLEYALDHCGVFDVGSHGIWGGTSLEEREVILGAGRAGREAALASVAGAPPEPVIPPAIRCPVARPKPGITLACQPSLPPAEVLLEPGAAAALLGISTWTLRRWANAGRVDSAKEPVRGENRYREADIRALVAARTTEAVA